MKLSKLASVVFAVLGTVLLAGSVVVAFLALNRPAESVKPAEEANACAQAVLDALNNGDFAGAAGYFYGTPSLGIDREPVAAEGKQVWDAYRGSVEVTADGGCYGDGANIYQTAQVTAMDIAGTLSQLDSCTSGLLKEKLETAEDPAALLDEAGEVPRALRDEVRALALTQVLAEAETVTRQTTFQLIEREGQWWVLPDQALIDILSAGLR